MHIDVNVTSMGMLLGMLSELTFNYLIMVDSMSLWLKESGSLLVALFAGSRIGYYCVAYHLSICSSEMQSGVDDTAKTTGSIYFVFQCEIILSK